MLNDAFGHLFRLKLRKPACLEVFFQLNLGGRHELTLRRVLCVDGDSSKNRNAMFVKVSQMEAAER
jgi:hypothetical protein